MIDVIVAAIPAVIAALPATLAALAAWRVAARGREQTADLHTQFAGNGRGNVTDMLEHLVDWAETHDKRHLWIDANIHDIRHRE